MSGPEGPRYLVLGVPVFESTLVILMISLRENPCDTLTQITPE